MTTSLTLGTLRLEVDADQRSGLRVFNQHDRIGILHLSEEDWRAVRDAMERDVAVSAVVEAARTLRQAAEAVVTRGWAANEDYVKAHHALYAAIDALSAKDPIP